MIISDNKKFIFIHIPKNSGTAMTHELQKTYQDTKLMMYCEREGINIGIDKMHLYYDVIDKFIPKNILENYFKFFVLLEIHIINFILLGILLKKDMDIRM